MLMNINQFEFETLLNELIFWKKKILVLKSVRWIYLQDGSKLKEIFILKILFLCDH